MKVKIGNQIYDSSKTPVLLILDDLDKKNITAMLPTATKYCAFPGKGWDTEEIREFMKVNE